MFRLFDDFSLLIRFLKCNNHICIVDIVSAILTIACNMLFMLNEIFYLVSVGSDDVPSQAQFSGGGLVILI